MTGKQPPAVTGTLSRLAAAGAPGVDRARRRLDDVLGPLAATAWPELVWSFSRLTNTGFPLEFAWTDRDRAIRWTAEVAPPEFPERERLDLTSRLAFGDAPPGTVAAVARLQAGPRLRFGAWLGVRHRDAADETKVYAELPAATAAQTASALGLPVPPVLHTVGLRARMVGILADGGLELYTRSHDLDERAVRGLEVSTFGRGDRLWPAVLGLVGTRTLPSPSGVSFVFASDGAVQAVTWFSFAKTVFASDGATVEALVARAADPGTAAHLTALAGGRADGRIRCGMVGVGVPTEGAPWFQVGVRPAP